MKFLLDSNVLSDIGNERPWGGRLLSKIGQYGAHRCFLSAVTYTEMLSGLRSHAGRLTKQKSADLALIYETLEVLPYHREAARAAAFLQAGTKGKLLPKIDCMVAGHAIADGFMMVTADDKDFSRMPGLTWVNWRKAKPA